MNPNRQNEQDERDTVDFSAYEHRSNPYLRKNRKIAPQKSKKTVDTVGKTENFGSRNVKLITFSICMVIFLAFFGPFGITRIVSCAQEARENAANAERKEMTLMTVRGLSEQGDSVTWKLLDSFIYENRSTKTFMLRVYSLEEGYEVWAGGETDSKKPTYLYLVNQDGERLEIRNGDIDAFLSGEITAGETESQ